MDVTLFPREDLYKNLYNAEFARFILEPVLDCIEEEVEDELEEIEETNSVIKNSKKKKKKKKKRSKVEQSEESTAQVCKIHEAEDCFQFLHAHVWYNSHLDS